MSLLIPDAVSPLEFDELRAVRADLRDYLGMNHRGSIDAFRTNDALPFAGYTRSATCLESLESAHIGGDERDKFALSALESDTPWQSDDAAYVYCAVRTLPITLAHLRIATHDERLRAFLQLIWNGVTTVPNRQGVRELTGSLDVWPSNKAKRDPAKVNDKPGETYPPNTFHTYWALRTLEEFNAYASRASVAPIPTELGPKAIIAWQWARTVLAVQTSLFSVGAPSYDGDQLGWALAIRLRWDAQCFASMLGKSDEADALSPPHAEEHELLRAGLAAYFRTQLPDGRWPRFAPLFHYPRSGNAYCYFFETLGEMLRPALSRNAENLRHLFRPHLESLLRTWRYARDSALNGSTGHPCWNSGHHPQRVAPESWATASVYSFLQNLRRLIAVETAATAKQGLRVLTLEKKESSKLAERGDTWQSADAKDAPTVAELLSTLFLHSTKSIVLRDASDYLDLDLPVFVRPKDRPGDWARSAILFGPPGTSKTSLVSAVAAAIGWPLIEVHASHFLQDGLERIPARADWIFARLMELDRCVVLFDELDELLRDRTGDKADPFGRFLTTLMLPKLTELWKQRRLIYFLNTNLVEETDAAIRRSERFDANILVETPSLEVKKKELGDAVDWSNVDGDAKNMLALVRYDQIATLKHYLRNGTQLLEALQNMFSRPTKGSSRLKELEDMRGEVQRDYRAERVAVLRFPNGHAIPDAIPDAGLNLIFKHGLDAYYRLALDRLPKRIEYNAITFSEEPSSPGVLVGTVKHDP